MSNSLQDCLVKFTALKVLRATAIEKLQDVEGTDEAHFDLSIVAPSVNKSIVVIDARVMAICELVGGIPEKSDTLLIPKQYIDTINGSIDQISTQYQSIVDQLASIDGNGGAGILNPEGLTLQSKNGKITLSLGQIFQNIWNQSENALINIYPLLNLVKAEGQGDFSAVLEVFSKALEKVNKQRTKLSNISKQAKAEYEKLETLNTQSTPLRDEIDRLKTESEKDRKTIAEYTSEGTQSITAIRTTNEQAEQLKADVDKYQLQFDKFQKQLDAREETLTKGNERLDTLLESVEEIDTSIRELNEKAEAMLSGATVAGLASSFGGIRDDLSKELGKARWSFYFAIGLLFVAVVPLAAYVIPGLADYLSLSSGSAEVHDASMSEVIGQIVARGLLLLPAAWFAKFAAARHAALFRLKEHYAYKYSVASSVDGFKKQAEPYKDQLAAATFFELTFNPADRMDSKGQEDRHPNPAMEWLMKKMGATPDGK